MSFQEDTAGGITLTASDAENNPLTYTIVSMPAHGMLTGFGPNRTYTPNANYFGADSFTFRVYDGNVYSNVATVSITVNGINDPPTLGSIANLTIAPDSGLQTITLTGVSPGPNESSQAITSFTAVSSQPGVVPDPIINFTAGSGTATLSFTPVANASGQTTITVTLVDDGASNNTVTRSFTLTVSAQTNSVPGYENPPPLPPPDPANTTNVSTVSQLIAAVNNLQSGKTISIAPGTYDLGGLTNALYVPQGISDWAIRGATGNRNDVVIRGAGMSGSVRFGIWISESPRGTIADLTIDSVADHGIQANSNVHQLLVHNVRIVDSGDQFVKSTNASSGNDFGIVEYSVFEYRTTDNDDYTNGVDVHGGEGWIVRYNLFRNILSPVGQALAGPAVLFWNDSSNSVVDGNTFINVARGISLGLVDKTGGFDHQGGVIRNNFFYRDANLPNAVDVPIMVADSPNTQVYHNTVINQGSYSNAIEYRFASSSGLDIKNNLTNRAITSRNGATATLGGNVTNASLSLFVNPTAGDLHLVSGAGVIDGGVALPGPFYDIDGQLRSGEFDVGADEHFSAGNNTAPVANAQTVTLQEDVATSITLTASDAEGNPLTYTIASGPAHGVLTGTGASRTYTPSTNYFGPDSFTFRANDGSLYSNSATVSIIVSPVNDPPSVAEQTFFVTDHAPAGTHVGTVVAADADPGTTLLYAINGGNIANAFTINVLTGAISVANSSVIDASLYSSFQLTVLVSDVVSNTLANVQIIIAPPPQILDNGQPNFSMTSGFANGANYMRDGDFAFALGGTAASEATWSFNVTPGQYRVWATWIEHPQYWATNAPFAVLDAGVSRGSALVNQRQAPNDLNDAGSAWEDFGGVYNIRGNTLTVRLSNLGADGYVIADAVRIQRVGNLPTAADIQVLNGEADVPSPTGNVNFGTVEIDQPVTKSFTIVNVGSQPLNLTLPISAPAGYAVVTPPATTLFPGQTTTFVMRLLAATPATYSGQVTITSNDGDENPFRFNVSGTVRATMIKDNGEPGFAATGDFVTGTGFMRDGDFATALGDASAGEATWTFDVTPGQYRVWATWMEHPQYWASNAPFTVLDSGVARGRTLIDQRQAPNDLNDAGSAWEDLGGEYNILGNTLTVRLSTAGANGYVVADGVRIQRVGSLPTAADIQVLNAEADVPDGAGSVDFGTAEMSEPLTKTLTIANVGSQPLTLTLPISVPTGYTVVTPPTATLAPGEITTFVLRFLATIPGTYSGQVSVASNDPDESPFLFNVSGAVLPTLIQDNGDPGFAETGFATGTGFMRDGDFATALGGAGLSEATWTFNVTPGQYRVWATWMEDPLYWATNAPFTVLDGGIALGTAQINQRQAPDDLIDAGSAWENLGGLYTISGNTLTVRLSNAGADGYVIADGIRIQRVGSDPAANGLVMALGFEEGSGTTAGDASGLSNSGVISGATWTTAGRFGGALSFDGVDDWVTVNDANSLDPTTGMTLEAWINPTSINGWETVVLKERPGGLAYALYGGSLEGVPAGYLTRTGTTVNVGGEGNAALPLDTWTHIATTYDGTTIYLYINGELVSSRTAAGSIVASSDPLRIGGNAIWDEEFFSGLIDEIRIYNRPLTESEIQADMNLPVNAAAALLTGGSGDSLCTDRRLLELAVDQLFTAAGCL
ncbi:MAG: tandem-95 repeat protein [Planctomycetes bacterium]|nr:tandem-95 repeat protein [Planctomycetota bacterium]